MSKNIVRNFRYCRTVEQAFGEMTYLDLFCTVFQLTFSQRRCQKLAPLHCKKGDQIPIWTAMFQNPNAVENADPLKRSVLFCATVVHIGL
jgi:hypothetical protein